ncbi:MAG TPA: alpha/beta hydrolase [Stellaceae bacterium]
MRLHYVERGAGRPLVLLHGMGSLLQDFTTSVFDDLARDYRAIALDRPGYGYSERPRRMFWTPGRQARLIHMALTRLGAERPIVLGHSWGVLVALAYALRYPNQTAAIVLLGGYAFPERRPDLAVMGIFRVPLLGTLLRDTIAPFAMRLAMRRVLRDAAFAPNPIPQRFTREFPLELSYRPTQIRALAEEALMLRPAAAALSRRYRDVAVPVIILAGESDRLLDARHHAIRLHRAIRYSATRIVPQTGHMIHHAAPTRVCEAVAVARDEAEAAS